MCANTHYSIQPSIPTPIICLGPDNIPNDIIKALPTQKQDLLFLFFKHCYKQKTIPQYREHSKTIILHKKGDLIHLTNYRAIALANTIYKLYISTLTTFLTNYGEQHRLLHLSQEGFRPQHNTSRQIQPIIATLEDARLTIKDIYLTYINFNNAFGSIDHARLLAIMVGLGYPLRRGKNCWKHVQKLHYILHM